MNFETYQQKAAEFAVYPKDREREYLSLGLISEVGELAGKLKKEIRDGVDLTEAILAEIGDCCWYAAMNSTHCNLRLGEFLTEFDSAEYENVSECEIATIVARNVGCFSSSSSGDMMRTIGLSATVAGLALLSIRRGTTLEAVCEANIAKLTDRKNRGKLQGSGDTR